MNAHIGIFALILGFTPVIGAADAKLEFFERRIRPLLSENCYECHSARSQKLQGALRLDTRQGWQQGGRSGRVIRPGSPDQSLLIRAVRQTDPDLRMPPPDHAGKLSSSAIADLVQWVRMGAPDPRDEANSASAPDAETDPTRHWSFQPVRIPEVPATADAKWPLTEVDHFIRAELDARKLRANPPATARTLIRRLAFDLHGLPPTRDQLARWITRMDQSGPTAVAAFIDELLDSPRFGERWGRHWLDVVRFAESSGHERNFTYPHAWRYRDYVIDSFNEDKPYDQFVREQIAGDLLPYNNRAQQIEQNIATGFLAIGPKNHLSRGDTYLMNLADDRVNAMSKSVLGLTIACARCHDHKFDPISTAEYHGLAGIFTSTESLHGTVKGKGAGNNSIYRDLFVISGDPKAAAAARDANEKLQAKLTKQLTIVQRKLVAIPREDPTPEQSRLIAKLKAEKAEIVKRQEELRKGPAIDVRYAMAARDQKDPADIAIRIKGVVSQKGDVAPRGFPVVLTHGVPPVVDPKASGRLPLAEWLTRQQNPLTARVMVNRIWLHLFGRGLVPTVDNFGLAGARPSHPALLDYLAARFMRDDWSVKTMIRLLTTSRVYQLSSAHHEANHIADPEAVYLWRIRPRRLEAEPLRDAILAVSGQLKLNRPPNGSVVAELGDGCLQRQVKTAPLHEPRDWRSVYLPVVRFYAPDMLEAFDVAPATLTLGQRAVTTVPAQSLFLLNNDFMVAQSQHAARRLLALKLPDHRARIGRAFELALGRSADETELSQAEAMLNNFPGEDPASAWSAFCQALFTTAEFRYVY